ncbi:HSV2 [[Candida] subhashii]|uniref:HSV2 n=1 Tax=[Candida] subhashii TaxID=561895 RepID=A0A8J5QIU5_9ASCO|nr:HSV2 [[Candida] subhashii]KAG7661762.1 HSV2 [[Candida] subhashii]
MNNHHNSSSSASSSVLSKDFLCINFNQDQGCFAIGHEAGFLVYNTNPIDLRVKRSFNQQQTLSTTGTVTTDDTSGSTSKCGIGKISMLHRTNYLALIGGGKRPKFPSNKLIIWDDLKRKISLILEFESPVLNVLLSRIRIVVVLINRVIVYGFSAPPKKFATYETIDNEFGIADLSVNLSTATPTGTSNGSTSAPPMTNSSSSVASLTSSSSSSAHNSNKYQTLAFPGRSVGQIQIVDVGHDRNLVNIIKAHKSKIRCLCLNKSGTLIASASILGTIIRVHSTRTTALLYEFRRGLDRAIIVSMKFSHDDSRLAVLSDKNTLHVFNINDQDEHLNKQHILNRIPFIPKPNYLLSTWSFVCINTNQYHQEFNGNDIGVIGWSGNDCIIIVWQRKKIWEKYLIQPILNDSIDNKKSYEIVRTSWKSLENE